MKKAIVIVNYNDYKTTLKLLDNIKDYQVFDKIVIVDNKSTDNSLEILKGKENNKIVVIDSKANKGYSYALNIGCKYLIDKYKHLKIIISNSDIIIDKESDIDDLFNLLSDEYPIIAPVVKENNKLNRGWIIPKAKEEILLNIPIISRLYENKHLKYPSSYYKENITKVDTVSGCFFLIDSKHLENMNYFDENIFLYYEENIMGVKTRQLKKNIGIVNNIYVIHNHSVSIDKSIKRIKKYDYLKKSQYYFEKEYNKANIIELLLIIITRYITRVLLYIKYLF